jgi:uncharacterized protein (TIGR02594 family)
MAARTKPAEAPEDDAGGENIENPVFIESNRSKPWLQLAEADIGLTEIRGSNDNERIVEMFATAGHSWVDDDETAWCAAAVCHWLEKAGIPSPKTLAARGFLKWGREISEPVKGCIVVMARGNPRGWQGHVGFYMGEADGGRSILVLGGNQRNAVNVQKFRKRYRYRGKWHDRVLSYRMPRRILRTEAAGQVAAMSGAGSTTAAAVATAAAPTTASMAPNAGMLPPTDGMQRTAEVMASSGNPTMMQVALYVSLALAVVSMIAGLYVWHRRRADYKERGV